MLKTIRSSATFDPTGRKKKGVRYHLNLMLTVITLHPGDNAHFLTHL